MSTNTVERSVEVCALDAATLCEAFQISAATHPEQVAVRTSGDVVVLTWAQYAERVRRTAAGLAALGVRRGDVVALMLTNRPEFLWVDAAAMHLGATTLGVYTTFAQEQVDYVLRDAGAVVAVTEKAFVPTLLRAREACPRLTHLVSVDDGQGMLSLEDLAAAGDPVAGLHLGHDRAAQRGAADPRRRDRQRSRAARGDSGLPGRFLRGVLPAAGTHWLAGFGVLLRAAARWDADLLSGPQ